MEHEYNYHNNFDCNYNFRSKTTRTKKPPPQLTPERLADIDEQMLQVLYLLTPTEMEEKKKMKLLSQVQAILLGVWLDADVRLYGSSGNQFGLRNADVDMCLFHTLGENESISDVVNRLGETLKK
eukprot:Awhi_evm2s10434